MVVNNQVRLFEGASARGWWEGWKEVWEEEARGPTSTCTRPASDQWRGDDGGDRQPLGVLGIYWAVSMILDVMSRNSMV